MAFAELSRLILQWYDIPLSYWIFLSCYRNLSQCEASEKHPNPTLKETVNPKWNTFCQDRAMTRGDGHHRWKRFCFHKGMHCFMHSWFEVLEGSWMGVSGAVNSLPVLSGWGLSPPPHRPVGFPIPTMLSSCRERQGLSVPLQGFTWPWLLQSWQDKQATSIPVARPHPSKGICCMLLYSSRLYNHWLWWLNHSGLRKNKGANLSVTPKLVSDFYISENIRGFLQLSSLQVLLSDATWAERDQELRHTARRIAALQSSQAGLRRAKWNSCGGVWQYLYIFAP